MRSYIKCLIVFFFLFTFNKNTFAECSYQERKELLNEVKNVNAFFDIKSNKVNEERINPNSEEVEMMEVIHYSFLLNIYNITNNMFVKITNDNSDDEIIVNSDNLNNGVYTYEVDNTPDIVTYYLTFYSTKANCYANKIKQISLKRPKENPVYYYSVCSNENVKNSKYCQQFITNEFNNDVYEIVGKLNKKIESMENKKDNKEVNILNLLKSYWYIVLILIILIMGVIFTVIHKKREMKL